MAALRVEVNPDNKKQVTRLAHNVMRVNAHTWRTHVAVELDREGRCMVTVMRDGQRLGRILITEPES